MSKHMKVLRYACAEDDREFLILEGSPLPSECPFHPSGGIKFLGVAEA